MHISHSHDVPGEHSSFANFVSSLFILKHDRSCSWIRIENINTGAFQIFLDDPKNGFELEREIIYQSRKACYYHKATGAFISLVSTNDYEDEESSNLAN